MQGRLKHFPHRTLSLSLSLYIYIDLSLCVSLLCLSLCIYTYIYYIWDLVLCHLDRRQKCQVLLALDLARIEGKLEECREATRGHG